MNTQIGLESKVHRSGFCAIRSPIFPLDGADLHGLYRYLEIQCRYVYPTTTTPSSTAADVSDIHFRNNTNIPSERTFTLNLRVTSALEEDIYQGRMALQRSVASSTHTDTTATPNHTTTNTTTATTTTDTTTTTTLAEETTTTELPFRTFIIPFDQLTLTARGRERQFQRRLTEGSVGIESIGFLLMDGINDAFAFDLTRIRAVNCLDDGTVYEPIQHEPIQDTDDTMKETNVTSNN